MPLEVYEIFDGQGFNRKNNYGEFAVFKIFSMDTVVLKRDKSAPIKIALIKEDLKIENVYKAVVEFVKWYNTVKL